MTAPAPDLRHGWFGPAHERLFAAWHVPASGRARGAVVLAPPIGLEALIAQRTMRELGDRLAARGMAALRFDYRATGDSAGSSADPDPVDGWRRSVDEAVAHAREAGARVVAVVGMRLGATIAATATVPLDALVLWDPCATGGRFLREEDALYRVGVPRAARPGAGDGVQGPGTEYTERTVAALKDLSIDAILDEATGEVRPGVGPVLVVARSESRPGPALRALIERDGVESFDAAGQPALFDWRALTVPVTTIDRIVGWLDARLPVDDEAVVPQLSTSAIVERAVDGHAVRERVVVFGPAALFGIVTEPVMDVEAGSATGGAAAPSDEIAVLANAAPPAFHVGPARMWVEIARNRALRGARTLRFDGRGSGESVGGGGAGYPAVYTPTVVEDLVAAIQHARELGAGRVATAGLCAAAWACLRAADLERVEAVHAINPSVWDAIPARVLRQPWPPPRPEAPAAAPPAASRRIRQRARATARDAARRLLPEPIWWRLAHRGLIEAPAGLITPLLNRGTAVHLLLGDREAARFTRLRGRSVAGRPGAGGALVVTAADEVDHALMSRAARMAVSAALNGWSPGATEGRPPEA